MLGERRLLSGSCKCGQARLRAVPLELEVRSLLVTQASKVAARGSISCLKFLVVVLFQRLIFLPSHVESVRAQLHRGPVRHARLDVGLAHVPLGEDFLVLYGFVCFDILG